MNMKNVYMDNNATTMVAPEVRDAMMPFFEELWGNPSSPHSFGGQVSQYVTRAREQVAKLINADPSEIVFTSGGSEGDNMAIRGTVEAYPEKRHLITSRVEHHAVLTPCRYLEGLGYRLTELNVDAHGRLDLEQLKKALRHDTALVSVMWANNETGTIFPLDEIAEIVKDAGCVLHTDAVQVVGKVPIDVRKTRVDLLSLSGHKFHTPKGIGAIYIRKGTKLKPLILGGHQESGKRAGTENVPYIVGLGKACELASEHREDYVNKVAPLRDLLQGKLMSTCPDTRINGDVENRVPNTLNISFEFIEGESILLLLDELGISASSGSACTSGSLEPSHVLRAMGVPFSAAHGSIRFSLSRYSTREEVDYIAAKTPAIVERLRAISPFVAK